MHVSSLTQSLFLARQSLNYPILFNQFPIVPVTRKVLQTQSKYYTVCDQGVLLGILGRAVPPCSQNPDPIVRPKNTILPPFSQSDMVSKINTRLQTSTKLPMKKKIQFE